MKLTSMITVERTSVGIVCAFALALMSHNVMADKSSATGVAISNSLHALEANDQYEPTIINVLTVLQSGKLEEALDLINVHLKRFPKSRIGHLLRADILKGMGGDLSEIGAGSALPAKEIQGLSHQLKNRWLHSKNFDQAAHKRIPDSLLDIGEHPYVLVADMQKGRLYVYENNDGQAELIRDYYMSVGSQGYGKQVEGDNKTPIGVYHVNRYIEGQRLPDLYGKGAFPVNYPNRLDRFLKRTGYGIWLHGTPSSTYARSPWTSEGCFVLSNDDLLDIAQFVSAEAKTPVILSDQVNWVDRRDLLLRKDEFLSVVDRWRRDWESIDTEAYLSHYVQEDLNFGAINFKGWANAKRKVNKGKTFIQVDLDIHEMFVYPGEKDMFVISYTQNYLSNNYSGQTQKKQYWKRLDSGQWKILFEG
ncbi:L,D-transpeptidase family protein [Arenicella sp. 4NH20-0111]|uniref:L,D-transpeptidase family protein n=1 Tax=Arenicella sp. 4NH20-0111 TaxID=3127648 RepID=UPI003342E071